MNRKNLDMIRTIMNPLQLLVKQTQKHPFPEYFLLKGSFDTEGFPHLLQFDGAAEPNPGPACGAAVLLQSDNGQQWSPVFEVGHYMPRATNNQAEYEGLYQGLLRAKFRNIQHLLIEGDSNLIVQQLSGQWKCKNSELLARLQDCKSLLRNFQYVAIRHIYRNENTYADELSKEGVMKGESFLRELPETQGRVRQA